jgi:uncharacterized protein involved in exopolysaccharide biosynthesis
MLYEALHVLFKWKILVCFAFLATFGGIMVGTYLATPRWEASTKLLVQQNPKLQPVIFRDLVMPGELTQRVTPSSSALEILAGREMAQEAVERFGLDERLRKRENEPEETRYVIRFWIHRILIGCPKAVFVKLGLLEEEEKDYLALAVNNFMEDWEDFDSAADSDVISLGIWGESPELATEISLFMAERLKARTMDLTASSISTTYDFARSQAPLVAEKLRAAEEERRIFKETHSITSLDEEIRIKMSRLDSIEADIVEVDIEKKANSERIRELKAHLDEQEERIVETGFIAGNSYIVNLKTSIADRESDLASILTEKKEKHPDVISLKNGIAESREALEREIRNIVDSETETMSPIYQDLVERLINAEIDEFLISVRWLTLNDIKSGVERSLRRLSRNKTDLARLSRKVEILENLHRDFEAQLEELRILNKSTINEIAIRSIDRAYISPTAQPSWPKLTIAIIVGFGAALVFALVMPFVFEFWTDSLRAWEVEQILEKTVTGEIFRA